MSEPMSNHEIEDVLSSIRRLVSDDMRPNAKGKGLADLVASPDAVGADAADKPVDKLLLTPAFRVVDSSVDEVIFNLGRNATPQMTLGAQAQTHADPTPEVKDTASLDILHDGAHMPESGDWGSDGKPLEQPAPEMAPEMATEMATEMVVDNGEHVVPARVENVVAKLSAAVTQEDEEWESPVGDVDPLASPDWSQPTLAAVTSERGEADMDGQSPTFVHRPLHYQKVAETAPHQDAAPHQAPDVHQDTELHPDPAPQSFLATQSDAVLPADQQPSDTHASHQAEVVDWEDPAPQDLHAELRQVVTPPEEPDQHWADVAEAAVMEDLAQTVEDQATGLFDDAEGGMVFDEEVLRDLVRDLIREELAGTLGERITRNVRKLVRAEIARALAVREFE